MNEVAEPLRTGGSFNAEILSGYFLVLESISARLLEEYGFPLFAVNAIAIGPADFRVFREPEITAL